MGKSSKRRKNKQKMPPLSFLDKVIYWLAFLLLFVVYIVSLVCPIRMRRIIAFSEESVVATHGNTGLWWLMIPHAVFFLTSLILCLRPYQNRMPIFGKRNFQYGPPSWPKIYPLFMKNKPYVFVSERKRKGRRQTAIFLLVLLLISFVPLPWSMYGRTCLQNDGSVVQYNIGNIQTHEVTADMVENVKIEVYSGRSHGSRNHNYVRRKNWGVKMTFITESGREYAFRQGEFREDTYNNDLSWLVAMINIKKHYDPDIIQYEGIENLNRIIMDMNMIEEEQVLLYRLFGRQ